MQQPPLDPQPAKPKDALPAVVSPTDEAYRALLEQAQAGVCVVRKGIFQFVNAKLAEMAGWTIEEMLGGMHISVPVHPDDLPMIEECSRQRVLYGYEPPFDLRCVRKDGTVFHCRAANLRIMYGGAVADLVTLTDITEVKEAVRTSEWRAHMLAQSEQLCRSGSAEIDLVTGRIKLSAGMYGLLGEKQRTRWVSHRSVLRKWLLPDEQHYVAAIWGGAVPGEPFEFQHRLCRSDGRRLVVLHRGIVETGADGKPLRGIAILQDITAQREAERRIQELAHYDIVTGLPNRSLLLDRVDAALHAAQREGRNVALLSVNVEQVQQVKQSIGYPAGDALATAIAARLGRACSDDDTAAHLGGGEFAILVDPRCNGDEQAALAMVRAVQSVLAGAENVGQAEVFLTCDVGVALFPADGKSAQQLLEASQTAMRSAAEQEGDGRVCFFKPEASARAIRRLALESALRHAIERDELFLHYQPQIDLVTGELVGMEALLRWRNEGLGPLSPVEFIPVAEQTGLIVPIGEWVLRTACEQILRWRRAGVQPPRVGVNLSTCQLQQADLAQRVQAILRQTGVDPAQLGVEVTESMLAEDVEHAARTLAQIRALGVKISLDDFGTGYSNLSYLNTLPIDVIKIDRSFVNDITAGNAEVSVTRAIIMMAHSLQMKVLAEGVETEGQLALLIANGCDQMQGYFFSKPVPPQDIETMLREGRGLAREVQVARQGLTELNLHLPHASPGLAERAAGSGAASAQEAWEGQRHLASASTPRS